jgi:quercetin dioxygenase-like cupin family protein
MSAHGIRFAKWDEIPRETVTEDIGRRLFTGERMMLAQVYLDEGAIVPWHSHENEQLTWVVSGALRFEIGTEGTDDVEEVVVREGDVLYIPSNVPHMAEALEDTLDVDIFSPPRQDWLQGTDTYFQDR